MMLSKNSFAIFTLSTRTLATESLYMLNLEKAEIKTNPSSRTVDDYDWEKRKVKKNWRHLNISTAYDLATQCPSRRASVRKHTGRSSTASFLPLTGTSSVPHSRPQSRQHTGVMSLDARTSLSPSPNASPSLSPRPRERASLKGHGIASSEFHEQNVEQSSQV